MTSLIDVIFLLLLVYMLTSTFTRFAEVELTAAGRGGPATSDRPPLFLQLAEDRMGINGQRVGLDTLAQVLVAQKGEADSLSVLVSLKPDVTAQRLTDLLVAMRSIAGVSATVLGAS
jgi:biopolymer transport protein ExbD